MSGASHMEKREEPLAEAQIRDALARVLNSPQLSASARLQDFLTYVVDESLHGRGQAIVGKIIAQDVYGRDPTKGSDNVVRVDARRLRRALAEYYGADGADDPVYIHIDKGHYTPRFEARSQADRPGPQLARAQGRRMPVRRPVLMVGAIIGLAVVFWMSFEETPQHSETDNAGNAAQERLALAAKSMATLQAANMSQKASELLFPIADTDHQNSATQMFKEAIRIDPEYSGGYAGAAHSLSTLAILAPDENRRQALLGEASQMSQKAVDLDPTNGWSVSSQAWLAFASGNLETAKELADRAFRLSDRDARVLDFSAVIFLLTGDFKTAQMISSPEQPRRAAGLHHAHRNIFGVASFHLGDYEAAISAFDTAIASGGPVSELTLLFKAAAYQADGQTDMAKTLLAELEQVWPDFHPSAALNRLYINPEHVNTVLKQLRAAGWTGNPDVSKHLDAN